MIREVKRDELSACAELIRKSFQTVADEFGFTEENAPRFTAFATTEERLKWHMDGEHRLMYLDEEDGRICGYYSLLLRDPGECELGSLSVLPEYRHRGIGGNLLLHAVKTAGEQGCTVMNLSIVEENTVLRSWYESYGAVHTGTEKFDFFPFTCGYMKIMLEETGNPNCRIVEGAERIDVDEVVAEGGALVARVAAAVEDAAEQVVGEVISDYATTWYLCDVIIDPAYQHRGLGKALVSHIASLPEYAGLRGFLFTRDAHGLYEKYGFETVNGRAMVKSPR